MGTALGQAKSGFAIRPVCRYTWADMDTEASVSAYLGLGSNLGDRTANLRTAILTLNESRDCRVTTVSSLYLTAPVGYPDQPDFVNAVVMVRTTLPPRLLLEYCLQIEETMGRQRTIRWGPRVIDIDILLYDRLSVAEDELVIPHPRMLERAFVLVPLAQIAPEEVVAPGLSAREAAESVGAEGVERLAEDWWTE